jgi:hypothetical protein
MNKQINEYNKKPVLSTRTLQFVETFHGGEIPDDIRSELEQWIKDINPFVEQNTINLKKQFENVFRK